MKKLLTMLLCVSFLFGCTKYEKNIDDTPQSKEEEQFRKDFNGLMELDYIEVMIKGITYDEQGNDDHWTDEQHYYAYSAFNQVIKESLSGGTTVRRNISITADNKTMLFGGDPLAHMVTSDSSKEKLQLITDNYQCKLLTDQTEKSDDRLVLYYDVPAADGEDEFWCKMEVEYTDGIISKMINTYYDDAKYEKKTLEKTQLFHICVAEKSFDELKEEFVGGIEIND